MRFTTQIVNLTNILKTLFSYGWTTTRSHPVKRKLLSGVIVNIEMENSNVISAYLTRDPQIFKYLGPSDNHSWIDCSPDSKRWRSLVSALKSRDYSNLPHRYEYSKEWDRIIYYIDTQIFTISPSDILEVEKFLNESTIDNGAK